MFFRQLLNDDTACASYVFGCKTHSAFAHEAVRLLRSKGRTARRLEDGWPEWRLADRLTTPSRAA